MPKAITRYAAEDGKEFDTLEEAKRHEQLLSFEALVGLDPEDIEEALAGKAPTIAEAFEKIGARLAKQRLAAGDRKRERKAKVAA